MRGEYGLKRAREWINAHPQRYRELIREGVAWRIKNDPGLVARRANKALETLRASGKFASPPSAEKLAWATWLRRENLTWREVARALGVAKSTVIRWNSKGLLS